MSDDLVATLQRIRTAAAEFDSDGVEDGIGQLERLAWDDGGWGVELFDGVKSLLGDPIFLNAGTSHRLVSVLALDWDDLSERQRAELRPLLVTAFDKFGDWIGALNIADMFGEHYADEAALDSFEKLSREAGNVLARAMAAYGVGRLAREFERGPLYDRAVATLDELAKSKDRDVAQEACGALAGLPRRD